jgi:hypothetical protein
MFKGNLQLAAATKAIWHRLLEIDNNIIGLFVCVLAAYDWMIFYDGIDRVTLYYSQGIYSIPSLRASVFCRPPFTSLSLA